MDTQFTNILSKSRQLYGIFPPKDEKLAESCQKNIFSVIPPKNETDIIILYGYGLENQQQAPLITVSDIIICLGGWRGDADCFNQYTKATELQKPCYEMVLSPDHRWTAKKI